MADTKKRRTSVAKLLDEATNAKTDERRSGRVKYNVGDHCIVFQLYGSVWGRVLPYCLVNVLITYLIGVCKTKGIVDMTFSDTGHTFMVTMVAFLVITRCNTAYQRWNASRKLLSDMMQACRSLIQHVVTFTRNETKPAARKWRAEISRRTVTVLRTIVSVIERSGDKCQNAWQLSKLSANERSTLILSLGGCNERSPVVLITFLRSAIAAHVDCLDTPLDVNQELILFTNACQLYESYHNCLKLSMTPFPFPLVQMTRTFLFIWIFTLPFALYTDIVMMPALLMMIFAITYGTLGLEFISIEMDDPFGDDPNDFDVMSFANVVFEDIYMTIRDLDGKEAALNLRDNVEKPLDEQVLGKSSSSSLIRSELLGQFNRRSHGMKAVGDSSRFLIDLNTGHVLRKFTQLKKLPNFKIDENLTCDFKDDLE